MNKLDFFILKISIFYLFILEKNLLHLIYFTFTAKKEDKIVLVLFCCRVDSMFIIHSSLNGCLF